MIYFVSLLEGIITFISPCLLPMLPIYIAYFVGSADGNTGKTMRASIGFVFGFSFADEHILEIVRRSMVNPFLKIYVIAYNKKSKDMIEDALGKGTQIEYIPKFNEEADGSIVNGNFSFLNSLLGGVK